MITQFKIYESELGFYSDITQPLIKKLHKFFNEFIELKVNEIDDLYVIGNHSLLIENDEHTLFKCGTENDLEIDTFRKEWFIIAYQNNVITPIFDNFVILENYILDKIKKYIEVDMSEDDGIKFNIDKICEMKDIKFDIEELKMKMEANKYNL